MILQFPDLKTLQLVLSTGVLPSSVSGRAVRYSPGPSPIVETAQTIPRSCLTRLKSLGVVGRRNTSNLDHLAGCWPEMISLQSVTMPTFRLEEAIFAAPDASDLRSFALQVMRLGNRRQALTRVEFENGRQYSLLRIVEPPVYCTLAAMESSDFTVLTRRSDHVWITAGFEHPLEQHLRPDPGKELLIFDRSPWQRVPTQAFEELTNLLDVRLPVQPGQATSHPEPRLKLDLELTGVAESLPPSFWIVEAENRPVWESFVRRSSPRTLKRLMFASGSRKGRSFLAVRLRPGSTESMILPENFAEYIAQGSDRRIYLPSGFRLFPPVSHEEFLALLDLAVEHLAWIESDEHGRPVVIRMPTDHFRPASDWVDYVISGSHAELEEWTRSSLFDFGEFQWDPPVLSDPNLSRSSPGSHSPSSRQSPAPQGGSRINSMDSTKNKPAVPPGSTEKKAKNTQRSQRTLSIRDRLGVGLGSRVRQESSSSQPLDELIQRLFRVPTVDRSQGQQTWIMIRQNLTESDQLGAAATVQQIMAWRNRSDQQEHLRWFDFERQFFPRDSQTGDAASWLENHWTEEDRVETVAAALWSVSQTPGQTVSTERIRSCASWLRDRESRLSHWACWLTWRAVTALLGGDSLELSRVRQRILTRVQRTGLQAGRDFPAIFQQSNDPRNRVNQVELLTFAQERFCEWSQPQCDPGDKLTASILGLVFQYARTLLQVEDGATWKVQQTPPGSPVAEWLVSAYRYRVRLTRSHGKWTENPLPEDLQQRLRQLSRAECYRIDRLRQYSLILDPVQQVDPFRRWQRQHLDDLGRKLQALAETNESARFVDRMHELRKNHEKDPSAQQRILMTGLENAARLPADQVSRIIQESLAVPTDEHELPLRFQLFQARIAAVVASHSAELAGPVLEQLQDQIRQMDAADESARNFLLPLIRSAEMACSRLGIPEQLGRIHDSILQWSRLFEDMSSSEDHQADEETLSRLEWRLETAAIHRSTESDRETVFEQSEILMGRDELAPGLRVRLACSFVRALRFLPLNRIRDRVQRLLEPERLLLSDRLSTSRDYQLSHVRLGESLAIMLADPQLGQCPEFDRWSSSEERELIEGIHADFEETRV